MSYTVDFRASALTAVGPPTAPAVGIAAWRSDDGTPDDGIIDKNVDIYVAPLIATAIDDVAVPAINATQTKVGEIIDNVNSLRK